jgi:hypothetical protein
MHPSNGRQAKEGLGSNEDRFQGQDNNITKSGKGVTKEGNSEYEQQAFHSIHGDHI